MHGLYILWRNAARFEDGVLSVHMHLDKKLPQAEIRSGQPYRGLLHVEMACDAGLRVRIPEFTSAPEMRVQINGSELPVAGGPAAAAAKAVVQRDRELEPARPFGNYLEIGKLLAGDRVEIAYPLPLRTEDVAVGNPGFRTWRYKATWKGDTVIAMKPVGNDVAKAYSDFDKADKEVYYGHGGPGPLYQRGHMKDAAEPRPEPLHEDGGGLDFWKIR